LTTLKLVEGNVDLFFLKVHPVSIVKPKQKKKAKGKMRRITSPAGKEKDNEAKGTNMEEDGTEF
jgi:hypothetical protein